LKERVAIRSRRAARGSVGIGVRIKQKQIPFGNDKQKGMTKQKQKQKQIPCGNDKPK
jgi:hypothetical protein